MIPTAHAVDLSKQFAFGHYQSLGQATSDLITPVFEIAGIILITYFLWGAVKLIMASGEKEQMIKARDQITHAILGFLILMFAFLIVEYLPEFFGLNFSIIH